MKNEKKPDFYAVVSAIAKFIEHTEKSTPKNGAIGKGDKKHGH